MRDTLGISFGEASTWRGIFLLLTLLGVKLDPAQTEAIIGAGTVLYALCGILFRRKPAQSAD